MAGRVLVGLRMVKDGGRKEAFTGSVTNTVAVRLRSGAELSQGRYGQAALPGFCPHRPVATDGDRGASTLAASSAIQATPMPTARPASQPATHRHTRRRSGVGC